MRELTLTEMALVAGGWGCYYRTRTNCYNRTSCEPKPVCEPKPPCGGGTTPIAPGTNN